MYKIKPLTNSIPAIRNMLTLQPRTRLLSSRPMTVGTSMVLIRLQSIILRVSKGRLRFFFGIRAKARARFIRTNCP